MLLKLILNLFSRTKRFKREKYVQVVYPFDLVFYQTPYNTTRLVR